MFWKSGASHFSHADAVSSVSSMWRGAIGLGCFQDTGGSLRAGPVGRRPPPPRAGPGHTGGITFPRPGINLVAFIQPCIHLQNIPISLDECKNHCPVMADRGFPHVFALQKQQENTENYKNLGNIGYDVSPTLSYGAVSFLHPNFCLWFLVIVARELQSGKTRHERVPLPPAF